MNETKKKIYYLADLENAFTTWIEVVSTVNLVLPNKMDLHGRGRARARQKRCRTPLLTDGMEMVPAMGRSGGGGGRRPTSTGHRRRRAKLGEAGGMGSLTPSGGGGS